MFWFSWNNVLGCDGGLLILNLQQFFSTRREVHRTSPPLSAGSTFTKPRHFHRVPAIQNCAQHKKPPNMMTTL
jgi:hypothetical protein